MTEEDPRKGAEAMFGRSKTAELKESVASTADQAAALAHDKEFRKQVVEAFAHATAARDRAASRVGVRAAATRLATDEALRQELGQMIENVRAAWARVEKKRSHRLRNTLLVLLGAGAAAAAAMPQIRRRLTQSMPSSIPGIRRGRAIEETIEVDVPVSTAYNQWTQFEEFSLFMQGVDHVEQRGDTRLHWVASVAGRTAEWDAKILEQHPDRQISWISEDGKKTRGTVTFEPLGEQRTLIRLSMSYKLEGPAEQLGSAAGLDTARIRGDLERFKQLIEARGTESGAWRGEVSAGSTS
jgi:uncharacterized membrane protein